MKVAILGAGAREHALAARFAEELGADSVSVSPGGTEIPGSFACAESELSSALRAREVTLVVIGPESMLARGVAEQLRAAGLAVLGPSAHDAQLETSKAFAKAFMVRHGVACAHSESVCGVASARNRAHQALRTGSGLVVKYDGLAAGKGVFVCANEAEVEAALSDIERVWGADANVVLEERLHGPELSLLAMVAGGEARLFAPVQDHKRLCDGDRGPMTGGMGAHYPVELDTPELRTRLQRDLVEPTLRGLRAEHPDYRGVLFFGVMLTETGPKLLEYNVRFGDPETQVLAVGMRESLSSLCAEAAAGRIAPGWISMRAGAVVCVVLAAPGYPGAPALGVRFDLPAATDALVFHAGSARNAAGQLVTSAGRVLSVVACGIDAPAARAAAYAQVARSPGLLHRSDIGARS